MLNGPLKTVSALLLGLAISAGAHLRAKWFGGQLNGRIPATTPYGSWTISDSIAPWSSSSPFSTAERSA